ncbi:MAG TPA: hypothetical protein VJN18_35895 [Polyangiaceae bacterium]|nr:hypothetical protein [Polyangiaceae bacterium]
MNARAGLVCALLLLPACTAQTAAERRDSVLNGSLESARLACLMILADASIPREPGVNEYCLAVVNGCPR